MLSKELLIEKGFKLNTYPEGKFWEYQTKDEHIIENILDIDFMGDEDSVTLQLHEDFSHIVEQIDCDTWDLTEEELLNILERMYNEPNTAKCDFCGKRVPETEIKRTHYGSGFGYTRLACPKCFKKLGAKEI